MSVHTAARRLSSVSSPVAVTVLRTTRPSASTTAALSKGWSSAATT
jgi:hypothetical protein